ncbi:YdeI family protein [Brevundimonas sp. PAMC22021]|uniref:YdeI/OmpD-associated family protein n=1 Tax=Brevundimonas sp. PAMC22021 TaxID=2861285 RepID=UPI001C62FE7D|nr:YdeI/OmpD-associated family protein [Brevundimonas sp. PAMC22021]QYF86323.1 YdeI/OmpD-associated family protein [Brevundimonas sp. PAMC22021]
MAPIVVDPDRIRAFENSAAFGDWLAGRHMSESEVWVRMFKVRSGVASVTWAEAVDEALCWGWIDSVRKGLDEVSFLQRFTPRGKKSVWSQVNVANVERLIADGRMTAHGLAQVEAAKADGRWEAAYRIRGAVAPDDLLAAIDAEPGARAMFEGLTAQNRFALIFRTEAPKTPAGRARALERLVAMLKRGETVYPQKTP